MTRAQAEARPAPEPAAPERRRPRPATSDGREAFEAMTGDVKLLLAVAALALVAGMGYMVFGPRPAPLPAVLGYVDAGPPPAPRPTAPPRPPFKLPWWK